MIKIFSYWPCNDPEVTYSDPMVTQSGPTHLPLPPHVSPDYTLAISYVKLNFWWWWWVVATKFSVSSRLGFKL